MKTFVVLVSFIYLFVLGCVGTAEYNFEKGMAQKSLKRVKLAERLNPLESSYFYGEYRLTGDLTALTHAMRLEPTKPSYRMYYGLALLKLNPRSMASDQEAVVEVCKAAELKPYSKPYRDVCDQYKSAILNSPAALLGQAKF